VVVLPVVLDDGLQQAPELLQRGLRAALVAQLLQPDLESSPAARSACGPARTAAAPGLGELEVAPVERQHLLGFDRLEDPVGELDFDFLHAPFPRLPHDAGPVDQAEDVEGLLATGDDVGRNLGALQPFEGLAELQVTAPAGVAVGGDQQVMRAKPAAAARWGGPSLTAATSWLMQ
jgi:hypothetical protein